MGNSTDTELVQAYKLNAETFNQSVPLFNIEDISFPLSTKGIKIVDAKGRRVKLAGGNWSGGHMCRHCVDGLQCRPMRDIAMDIRYKFKMNCIRLTYSLQLFFENKPVQAKYLTANPQLIGKTAMEIFDITVNTLTDVGLMVILNNHTSTSQWCCSNEDGDGLWWSRQFPQHMFFQNAQAFAKRYSNNPRVIGSDLRNQLRKAYGLSATWGDGNPLTDWKRAAKICADKVQKIAPHWLILVSGLDYQLDLSGVQNSPLTLAIPNKLVYTGHFYGFSWVSPQLTSWNMVSYESFKDKFFNTQTLVRGLGYPYFLGQYGNNQKDIPWNYLIKYLKQTDIDWTYWALDGFKCQPKQDETYGVFTNDFSEARHPDLLEDMISVGPPPGTIIEPPKNNRQLRNQNNQRIQERRAPQRQVPNYNPNEYKELPIRGSRQTQQNPQYIQKSPRDIYDVKPPNPQGAYRVTESHLLNQKPQLNQAYQPPSQIPRTNVPEMVFQPITKQANQYQPQQQPYQGQKLQVMQSKKLTPITPPEQQPQRNYPAQQQQPYNSPYVPPQPQQFTNQPNYGQGFTGGQYQQGNNQIYPSYPTGMNQPQPGIQGNVMNMPVNFGNLPNSFIPKR